MSEVGELVSSVVAPIGVSASGAGAVTAALVSCDGGSLMHLRNRRSGFVCCRAD